MCGLSYSISSFIRGIEIFFFLSSDRKSNLSTNANRDSKFLELLLIINFKQLSLIERPLFFSSNLIKYFLSKSFSKGMEISKLAFNQHFFTLHINFGIRAIDLTQYEDLKSNEGIQCGEAIRESGRRSE